MTDKVAAYRGRDAKRRANENAAAISQQAVDVRSRAAAEILTCCRISRKLLWYLRVIMDAPNYVILKNENDHTTLVNAVNKLIDEGYTPLGGLTVLTLGSGSLVYIQAMVSKRGATYSRQI